MAAKLLHSLADDNPDMQKQIGCMTGIFQLFDRHQALTGSRRLKRLPPGESQFSSSGSERESLNVYHHHTTSDMNFNKSLNEKQRTSTESSRASFSSSCSSISSLDGNKTAQAEASSYDRILFAETPARDPVMAQPSTYLHLGCQSLGFRDVVKDSMYREAKGLSVKTATKEELMGQTVKHKQEAMGNAMKHKDSPRPLQLSKSVDGSCRVGSNEKQNVPDDIEESLRVLTKLREAPWYYCETRERRRSLYEGKDGSWRTISRDAPRFSYDGKEINRLSFESRDAIKSTPKLKELPRLSLDSRETSMRGYNSDSKSEYISRDFQNSGKSNEIFYNPQQSMGAQKQRPSVVAKLMGLEPLPESASTSHSRSGLMKASPLELGDSFSRSLKPNNLSQPIRIPKSPRSSPKEPISPRWKNPDLVMKPVSRLPIEPAPWKQLDGSRGSLKPAFKPAKVPSKSPNSFPSVYSEIEKRLKDLEFNQSGKGLRALKQILEAMQAKGLLETRKEEQNSNFGIPSDHEARCTSANQTPRLLSQRNKQGNHVSTPTTRVSDSLRTYKSPIVIMKPAKLVDKSGFPASSVIPIDDHSRLHKISSGGNTDINRGPANNRTAKDQSPRNIHGDSAVNSSDKKTAARNTKPTQSSTRPQPLPKDSTSSARSTGSVSPRLQQKKLELERRSRPPTPPTDSNKPRRQSSRHPTELGSPGGKYRLKTPKLAQSDDQLSQISSESRTSSHQGDDTSLQSEGTIVSDLKTDIEVTSAERSIEVHGSQMHNKPISRLEEDGTLAELTVVAPSPVSVLDASVYRDDSLSPVKQIPRMLKGDDAQDFSDLWNPADSLLSNCTRSGLSSEINRKKLQNIENLVQKLRQLNSTHDETSTDYIASLCENRNPDHRYISEILLASGLLLRDLGSGLTTFHLHSPGYPINPELFFVLEQTKASTLPSEEECIPGNSSYSKSNPEKFHRKLIFDAVNEILAKKLALLAPSSEPWLKSDKLAKKTLSAQKLLKGLCSEIEQLQVTKSECGLEDEDDGLKSILWEDVMCRSESWTAFHGEISGLVLDIERLVFKDLIDEIVIGEAAGLRTNPGHRRQLFAK